MISYRSFVTLLLVCVAVSRAEEAASGKEARLESRWLGGLGALDMGTFSYYNSLNFGLFPGWISPFMGSLYGGCYGLGYLGSLYNNFLFAKAADTPTVSRRAVSLDAGHLFPRRSDQTVSCVNEKGASNVFVASHCNQAANKLAEKKLSHASCGTCALTLVSPKTHVAPEHVPGTVLQKTAQGILDACSNPKSAKHTRRGTHPVDAHDDKQVVMILSKGDQSAC